MKEPKRLKVKDGDYYDSSLSVSNLSDENNKVHVMTSNYGEVTSASINKTQVKSLINWLNRWLKFKDAYVATGEGDSE